MDLFLALTATAWAVGGAVSALWLAWLDRRRREISFPVKTAMLVGWPVLMLYALWHRGDMAPGPALRWGSAWTLALAAGFAFDAADRLREPEAVAGVNVCLAAPPEPVLPVQPIAAPAPSPVVVEPVSMPSETDTREAIRYWNAGIIEYQKGDYEAARHAWGECKRLDPANSDCTTGLQRIDQSYGATPVLARSGP